MLFACLVKSRYKYCLVIDASCPLAVLSLVLTDAMGRFLILLLSLVVVDS